MKSKLLLMAGLLLATTMVASAQGGGRQMPTVEDRVKAVMEKLEDFKLDADKTEKTKAAFTEYYTAQQKMFEEMRSSGERPDRDAMREKMTKLTDARDAKLKEIFTEDQYKKWKDEIEPSMRPQRGGRGGGNGGGSSRGGSR